MRGDPARGEVARRRARDVVQFADPAGDQGAVVERPAADDAVDRDPERLEGVVLARTVHPVPEEPSAVQARRNPA